MKEEKEVVIYPAQRKIWEKAIPNWKKRSAIEDILEIMKQDKKNPFADDGWDIEIVFKNKLTLMGMSHGMLDIIKEKIEKEKLLDQYIKDSMTVFRKLRKEYPDGMICGKPTLQQLHKYAEKVSKQLSFILAYEDKKIIYRLYDIESRSPLAIVEFEQIQKNEKKTLKKKKVEGIEYILSVISDNLRNEISDNLFTRGHLRIYEKDRLFVIKPNEKRFWTESSALNDVSNIIHEHMRPEIYEKPTTIWKTLVEKAKL